MSRPFGRRWLLIAAGVAASAGACACRRPAYGPPPVARCETPEGVYAYFRECIHSGDYNRAWWCLSRQARGHLPLQEFEAGFQSYGAVRDLITASRIRAISIALPGDRAELTMENTAWRVRRVFRLVLEPIGAQRLWQIDLTRADLEDMARQAQGYAGPAAGRRAVDAGTAAATSSTSTCTSTCLVAASGRAM